MTAVSDAVDVLRELLVNRHKNESFFQLPGAVGYGHTGLLNTYTTLLWHFPSENVTIALEVNRSDVDLGGMIVAEPSGGPSLFELATGIEPPEPTPSPSPSPPPSPTPRH